MDYYSVAMPYIGGILTDNGYKIGKTKKTHPIVTLWIRDLASRVESLEIPKADNYRIELWGRFWDERRPDLANLHKVIGDSLKRVLVDDKHFFFFDRGCELGVFEQELVITIKPITKAVGE